MCFSLRFGSVLMPVLYLLKENFYRTSKLDLFDFLGVSHTLFTDGVVWEVVFFFLVVCLFVYT